jgi:hypothetical protein
VGSGSSSLEPEADVEALLEAEWGRLSGVAEDVTVDVDATLELEVVAFVDGPTALLDVELELDDELGVARVGEPLPQALETITTSTLLATDITVFFTFLRRPRTC